ncbi:MAG: hypothetical protein FJ295_12545 [Planctomycetes bacterium]|nr:hypothetical protein [Planctomycetota bacterium]
MNRIQMQPGSLLNKPSKQPLENPLPTVDLVQARVRVESTAALFAPLHYERNYAYPLLVWCHGPGDDERQLQRVMPLISMRNYVAVAPRGVSPRSSQPGFSWGEDEESTQAAERRVLEAIQLARSRFHVAADRIFLAGLHCGGTMALRVGLRNAGRFAGLASIGGGFPQGRTPLRDLRQLRNLPLFIACNRDSRRYTTEQSCADLRLVHSAGMGIALRQYPCGDELTTKMLSDLNVWLMERVTGQAAQPESTPEDSSDWN